MSNTKEHAFLSQALLITGTHHEKWDGSGYPVGLKGNNIPLEGRIMSIVDVYDALISERPYKKAFSHEEACEIIVDGAGTHFDPLLVDCYCPARMRSNSRPKLRTNSRMKRAKQKKNHPPAKCEQVKKQKEESSGRKGNVFKKGCPLEPRVCKF
jgi:HD-GYP domain-containing protein (c-di-GMP phosphodiesterase class II)